MPFLNAANVFSGIKPAPPRWAMTRTLEAGWLVWVEVGGVTVEEGVQAVRIRIRRGRSRLIIRLGEGTAVAQLVPNGRRGDPAVAQIGRKPRPYMNRVIPLKDRDVAMQRLYKR